jgi:hypothetical protein
MSELLLRGWNVAVPVVDVGDDVLVVDDNDKTTCTRGTRREWSGLGLARATRQLREVPPRDAEKNAVARKRS